MRYTLECEIMKLLERYPILRNKSRKKFLMMYILALIQSRKVQFCETATYLNNKVQDASNETRIQDFYREANLDYEQLAILFFCIFPSHQKLDVIIDRTEWDFGKYQCNILMVIISNRTIAVPLYWELLDNNSGNSNTQNRIDLLSKCLQILLPKRICIVLGDREFIGHSWIKYLKDNKINFCFRIPKHHQIIQLDEDMNENVLRAEDLHKAYPQGIDLPHVFVDGVCGHVSISTDKKGELLYLFGSYPAQCLPAYYKRRWTIEAFFQNLKGRGFDLESTHLQDNKKLKMLVAHVSLAYIFCINTGLQNHRKVQKIRNKKHGRKSNSFFRTGLNIIRNLLKTPDLLDEHLKTLFRTICINYYQVMTKKNIKEI